MKEGVFGSRCVCAVELAGVCAHIAGFLQYVWLARRAPRGCCWFSVSFTQRPADATDLAKA